ncbi:CYFA0S06e04984g1_1 [Cyberlindnera fabianii]|uniref:CYFA0S06e04984g1_1 n=1 Tax=Cyberlindnera fabianii TaxID=36022 RepID=A0A061AUD9_CYBFA|nr:Non-classical export protein 2 [Cyberlindnera fabianii]CDR41256.1 CYFA0S06e04984g1_1 [Cyberlindnera fabianii]
MLKFIDIGLRAFNFACLVIVLGLTGSLIHGQEHSNSRVNFAIFTAVFGIVFSSIYGLLANFIEFLAWPLILLILDVLNLIFTFASAVALAVGIRVHSCTNQSYLDHNSITQGSTDRCRKAQASTAFLFFAFFTFLFSGFLSTYSLLRGGAFGSKSTPKSGGIPTISA